MSDHQYYQAPPPYQPPPKKSWVARHKILTAAGGVLLFVVVVSVATSGGSDDTKPAAVAPEQSQAAPVDVPTEAAPEKPTKAPASYGDGDYAVGEDIPAGTYTSDGAKSDLFDFCAITTKPADPATMPQIKSANAGDRIIITLSESDGVVTLSGCEPLKPRG